MTASPLAGPTGLAWPATATGRRAAALADRLERGAAALAEFGKRLSEQEWWSIVPRDGRRVGLVIHHVASAYPLEVQFAWLLAQGKPLAGVTTLEVAARSPRPRRESAHTSRADTLALLRRNSAVAAAAVRGLTDEQLDRSATVSLYAGAPVTCQFMLEDHAIRHSYYHLARLRQALAR